MKCFNHLFLFFLPLTNPYPDGAPSCVSRPGHGDRKQAVRLEVVKIAEKKWQVGECEVYVMRLDFICPALGYCA